MAADPARRQFKASRQGDRPRAHAGDSEAEKAIFDALSRLLDHVALRDISVSQVIAEAQISRATFYFYFSSKFAVVTGLIAVVMEELSQAIAPSLRREDPIQALRLRLEAMAAMWARHRAVLRAVSENWHAVEELKAIWLDMIESFTDALAREIARERASRGAPPGPDAHQAAALVLWATERTLYIAGLGVDDDLPGEQEVVEVLLPLWAAAIYP
jgi:AcrR family transcriptional regulator